MSEKKLPNRFDAHDPSKPATIFVELAPGQVEICPNLPPPIVHLAGRPLWRLSALPDWLVRRPRDV